MDHEDDILPPLEALVEALLDWTCVTSQILDHMAHYKATYGGDGPPIPVVIRTLLGGTLEEMAGKREFEVGVAARVIQDATEKVATEIFMVPPDFAPNRAERRRRRRRRGR